MPNSRKLTIAVVAISLVAVLLSGTASGRDVLRKLYVAVACSSDYCWASPPSEFWARSTTAKSAELDLAAPETTRQRGAWPVELTDQVLSVRRVLAADGRALNVADVAKRYQRAPKARIESTLATLAALGHVRALGDGRFAALR